MNDHHTAIVGMDDPAAAIARLTDKIDELESQALGSGLWMDEAKAQIAQLKQELAEVRQQLADSKNCLSTIGYLLGISPDKWSTPSEFWQVAADTMTSWYRYGDYSNHAISCRDETALRALDFQVRQLREQLAASQAERNQMRNALLQAKEWLEGWASAEPQLQIINAALAMSSGTTKPECTCDPEGWQGNSDCRACNPVKSSGADSGDGHV